MRPMKIYAAVAGGIILGAIAGNSIPAYADMPVIDWTAIGKAIQEINILGTINSAISSLLGPSGPIASVLGNNAYGTVQQLLQEGFTQEANYSKAEVGAQEQITDASNEAMAQFDLQLRDAEIRDEQTASPAACAALDGGVSTQAAAVQAYDVAWEIGQITDARNEAQPNMPSYYGQAQGFASMAADHLGSYCDPNDIVAGLCTTLSAQPDADQRFSSLFGSGTYSNQQAVNTTKDYAVNLIEPVAPAALRGDQLSSIQGQEAGVDRRSFNARMSLAQGVVNDAIGMQTPAVPLTPLQQQYLTEVGLPSQQYGSMLQVLQIEAERRFSSINWNAELQAMPPASVEREIALELALSNYIEFQILELDLKRTTIGATQLAVTAEQNFMPIVRMPTPSLANN